MIRFYLEVPPSLPLVLPTLKEGRLKDQGITKGFTNFVSIIVARYSAYKNRA